MAANAVTAQCAVYQCKSCERELEVNAFYASNQSKCKECVKEAVRKNRLKNVDYYREYDRKRFQDDPRVKARRKRYQNSEAGKEAMARSRNRWKANNPEKRSAHVKFGNALRGGKVKQGEQCGLCGCKDGQLEAHQFDYSKPLSVTWLCKACHMAFHATHDLAAE